MVEDRRTKATSMYWTKIFTTKTEIVVALCDEDILEKVLDFKKKNVKIKVSKHFYGERLVDESTVLKLMDKATIGNLIGRNIVQLAEKHGFISKENVINIDGIPHAQFVKLEER
ncbi:MAG: DUF424 family protein [Candidatus Aenigmatarchaeota archaeon]|nr:DUF424 family protein [Candidatus Aenigmarchaeota archaeon]